MNGHHPRTRANNAAQQIAAGRANARQRVGIRGVAGKELVAAVAGQADRHVLPRERRHVVGRNRRCIGERLVVVIRQGFRDLHRIGRDDLLVMFGAKRLGGAARFVQLVVVRDRRSQS